MRSFTVPQNLTQRRWTPRWPLSLRHSVYLSLVLAAGVLVLLAVVLVRSLAAAPGPSSAPGLEWRTMMGALTRSSVLPVEGREAPTVDVLFATPDYFASTRKQVPASALAAPSLLFYVTEATHIDDLPAAPPEPVLRLTDVDGGVLTLPLVEKSVLADSAHHRSTMARYDVSDPRTMAALQAATAIEMVFPAPDGSGSSDNLLAWELPLAYTEDYVSTNVAVGAPNVSTPLAGGVSGVAILAVLGGLLAAMWPCLFQLTAYFIPAMAGMSVGHGQAASSVRPRMAVVRTAVFFVVGFTIVYTLAGAVIGFGSQQLANMESFYVWQRYLSIGAGVILFGLAFRVAARARAPLVCKMPLASRFAHKEGTSPWESMLVGITFATGCMTCFGSAILIGMVLYVGLAGSALVGAGLLFLFSLGMGVPLVIGAIAMARVLPLLFKLEKVIPWMGLASAVLIAGYGVLLISGNFMAASGWIARLFGLGYGLG